MTDPSPTAHDLATVRARKDAAFRDDPHSPLTPDQRQRFTGLAYYPFNPKLSLELTLDEAVSVEPVILDTSTGESQEYQPAGTVHFAVEGTPVTLTVYRDPNGELFLPIRDGTSGMETYGAGRYLEPQLLPDGRVRVDFNELYNPYCAYNDAWSCPLPPRENWLTVPIRAGEQTYHHNT